MKLFLYLLSISIIPIIIFMIFFNITTDLFTGIKSYKNISKLSLIKNKIIAISFIILIGIIKTIQNQNLNSTVIKTMLVIMGTIVILNNLGNENVNK